MINCSICDEIFVASQKDSTYSTPCGHLFHYNCLTKWLDRSETCPHCRSPVTKNEIIKLFLQFDPISQTAWNKKTHEDALNDQIEALRKKENNYMCTIDRLVSQLRQVTTKNEQNKNKIDYFQTKCTDYGFKLFDLQSQHQMLESEHAILSDQKRNVEFKLQLEESKLKALDKNFNELQSVNCVIIDKLRSEIADLKSQKAFYKGKCNSLLDCKSDGSLIPPKLTIENKEICLPQIRHVKREYHGNDPNLIWSSTNFLGGCVFLIVGDHNNYEDICNDTSMIKLSIIDFGGTVELVYSSNITHIISATQNHYLVEQGIKDGVRCVTDDWLADVICKRVMCPPWLALHFPSRFGKETILPCQNYHIAIAQFDKEEYQLVKKMVELTGACVVDEVTSTTDVVVSQKLEGELVEVALALNRPIVNIQWLNDVLFGAQIGLNNPTCMNYQQFDLTYPFSVNYDMVSHLMDAWKSPVVFLTNPEVYDLTTDGSTSPICKKLKTETGNPELIDLAHDDDDDDDLVITYVGSNKKNTSLPLVMFCGFSKEEIKELKRIVLKLGGYVTENFCNVTHLVMKEPFKSISFLLSLSSVTYVVNEFWLKESLSSSTFKNELDYCIGNVYDELHAVVCKVPEILKITTRKVLFEGKSFFITPGCKSPSPKILNNLINWAGGVVECRIRNVDSIKSLLPNSYFIISCEEDVRFDIDLLMSLSINAVFSSDFIIHSIMQQKLMLEYVINV